MRLGGVYEIWGDSKGAVLLLARQYPNVLIGEHGLEHAAHAVRVFLRSAFASRPIIGQLSAQSILLLLSQPFGFARPIRQHLQSQQSQNDRRNCFKHQQPLPTGKVCHTVHVQQQCRQRRADEIRQWNSHHEYRNDSSHVRFGRKMALGLAE